jgi:outer membrane protein assembly factor BamE (lipoprotein component of BamABCDE complex)
MSLLGLAVIVSFGCMSAAQHQASLGSAKEREMTLGVVQKEIRTGMSQADVAEALGSPNIVTKDSDGNETWIYDKIASEVSYSKGGSSTGILVALFAGGSKEAGASSSTQRTLTVVIKFDHDGKVQSSSYHASKF